MKFDEALLMPNFYDLAGPGTIISTQVVQPTTFQTEPDIESQAKPTPKRKNLKKVDLEKYNKKKEEKLRIYYES